MEYIQNGNAEDEAVEYTEDCFDDMERPNFGYRVKIMTKEDEPCTVDFENPDQTTCQLSKDVKKGKM